MSRICAWVYVVMVLLTSGYATNADWIDEKPNFFDPKIMMPVSALDNSVRGVACGVVWPFYISYKLFGFVRPSKTS